MFNVNDLGDDDSFGCEHIENNVLNAMIKSDPIDYSKIDVLNVRFRNCYNKLRSEALTSEEKANTTYVG